ncbi:MAG: RsbRD N-terminal domain-containing protein [Chlorobiaceae bacterium]|jgi:RsbT co-antagonist protein rsbRD N-terminal domain
MKTRWTDLLEANKKALLEQWLDCALALFPEKMGYSTPIAMVLSGALEKIVSGLGTSENDYKDSLDDVTRILAVQNIPPSKALSIFLEPKLILRDIMKRVTVAGTLTQEVQEAFNSRLDALTLEAFDSYMRHREKIYQLKVEEGSRRMHMALRRVEA